MATEKPAGGCGGTGKVTAKHWVEGSHVEFQNPCPGCSDCLTENPPSEWAARAARGISIRCGRSWPPGDAEEIFINEIAQIIDHAAPDLGKVRKALEEVIKYWESNGMAWSTPIYFMYEELVKALVELGKAAAPESPKPPEGE